MEKVNKEENQSNIAQFIGNNNTIAQNNYNNQITIDSDFLLEMTKKQHKLYPYFYTGIDKFPNGKVGYKSIPANEEAEKKFPLSIKSNVTVIDNKYKEYKDLNKMLQDSYNNQEPIKVKVNSTIQMLGEEIDPYQPFLDEEIVESYIFPQRFPNVPIVSIGFIDSDFIIDGIQLKIVKKESDNITYLNNEKQDSFIVVKIKLVVSNIKEENSSADVQFNFNFNINDRYKDNLDANITFYKILLNIAEGKEMYMKFFDNPKKSMIGRLPVKHDISILKNTIRFCEVLKKINTTFNLNLTKAYLYTKSDYDSISFLEKILFQKHIKKAKEITLKLDASQIDEENIKELIKEENSSIGEVREDIVVPLLDNNLHISKIIKIYTNFTIKNKNELIADMKSCIKNNILNIVLIPKNGYIDIETRYEI